MAPSSTPTRAQMRLRRAAVVALCGASFAAGAAASIPDRIAASARSEVDLRLSRLSLAQLAGQRIVSGFHGERIPGRLRRAIERGRIAGVVLFSENFDSVAEAADLVAELQAIERPKKLPYPLLIMVDQEGGQVKRLPFHPTLSAEEMGAREPGVARRQGRATARDLRGVGVNVDLAPVLDVARDGGAIDTEDRAFGDQPEAVSRHANPFAAALERNGIAATAKHFPGLGAAATNTDLSAQEIDLSRKRIRRFDEFPYRRFIRDGGSLVMLSMAVYPAFGDLPASLSGKLATKELRGRLGFEGVSITDALDTPSGDAVGGTSKVARLGARAGTDILLYADLGEALEARRALAAALREGGLALELFRESVRRILTLRDRVPA